MILAATALAGVAACRDLLIDLDRVIAIEVATTTPKVQEGDTVRLAARLLNAAGAVVPGVQVTWAADDTVTGFTLDKNSGLVTALAPGAWKVWARYEKLQSDAMTLTITPMPIPAAHDPEPRSGEGSLALRSDSSRATLARNDTRVPFRKVGV